jgi:hypothetical protein
VRPASLRAIDEPDRTNDIAGFSPGNVGVFSGYDVATKVAKGAED